MRQIMKRAHVLAGIMEGDYIARLALGLSTAWLEYKTVGAGVEEILTVRSRGGIKKSINFSDIPYIREIKGVKYAEATGKFWANLGYDIPKKYYKREMQIEIVEQERVEELEMEKHRREVEEEERQIEGAMNAKITGFLYKIGCDCGDTLYFQYEDREKIDWRISGERSRRHEKLLEKVRDIVPKKFKMNIDPDGGSYGGYEIGEEIVPIVEEAKVQLEREREERKQKAKKKRNEDEKLYQEKIEEAKKTGRPVFIRTVGGYDGDERYPGKELGWVNVVEIATPEGKIKTEESPSY